MRHLRPRCCADTATRPVDGRCGGEEAAPCGLFVGGNEAGRW
jgi:hypothetical protein